MIDTLDEIRRLIDRRVAGGFDGRGAILEDAKDYARDAKLEGQDDAITRHLDDALACHRREQESWTRPTDCDRLDAAFAALEAEGIVARQHFSCCSTCGHVDVGGEIRAASQQRPVDGYVFYHVQNTESAAESGTLYLSYGATKKGDEPAVAVARRIVAAIERSGLKTEWNGRADTCVVVSGMDWKRWRS